ncbi:MAG: type II toxin-antitoxin system prevent-host-death family antitoxin [Microthrixaceae bacterium]
MPAVNISAARAELPKLIDAVERGQEATLTRHGRPGRGAGATRSAP